MAEARTWSLQAEAGWAAWGAVALLLLLVAAPAAAHAQAAVAQRGGLLRRDRSPYKPYTGLRADPASDRQVYVHEQTIAVVELGPRRALLNCELIEVTTPKLAKEALQNLSSINKPIRISFANMKMLMHECKDFESPDGTTNRSYEPTAPSGPWTVLTGIIPGTKWCGNGDLAKNYFDLGHLTEVDKCCRAHDLCPMKVQGFQTRYNLTNLSFYTKSHCDCDSTFYQCLKQTQHATANLMGTVYFNLIKVQCIDEVQASGKNEVQRTFRNPKQNY